MKVLALIPAYNEEKTLGGVLTATQPFVDGMLVVNDGSTERTSLIARAHGAIVVEHVINRGLGAAIGTAATGATADAVAGVTAAGLSAGSETTGLGATGWGAIDWATTGFAATGGGVGST